MLLEKTLNLLSVLNKRDLQLLERELKASKKSKTLKLHNFCKQKKIEKLKSNKITIYKAVFNQLYSDKNDYLLRNEIRLYNDSIKEIIAWVQLKKNPILMKRAYFSGIQDQGLSSLMQNELQAALKNNISSLDYEVQASYLARLSQIKLNEQGYTSKKFEDIKEIVLEEIKAIHLNWNDLLSQAFLKLAFAERVLTQLSGSRVESDFETLRIVSKETSSFADFNYLKAQSYQVRNESKIENLEKIIAILKDIDHPKVLKNNSLAVTYASLALEYLLQTNYQKAVVNFEKCKHLKDDLNAQQWSNISLNYLSSLCKLGDFGKARSFIESNKDIIENEETNSRILPNVIGVYILTGNIKEAETLLPQKLKEGEFDAYHYYRIMQAIIHFENNLLELAENEMLNLRKHLYTLSKEKYQFTIDLVQLILSFISAKFSKLPSDFIEWKASFQIEIQRLTQKHGKLEMDSILVYWLKKKLD